MEPDLVVGPANHLLPEMLQPIFRGTAGPGSLAQLSSVNRTWHEAAVFCPSLFCHVYAWGVGPVASPTPISMPDVTAPLPPIPAGNRLGLLAQGVEVQSLAIPAPIAEPSEPASDVRDAPAGSLYWQGHQPQIEELAWNHRGLDPALLEGSDEGPQREELTEELAWHHRGLDPEHPERSDEGFEEGGDPDFISHGGLHALLDMDSELEFGEGSSGSETLSDVSEQMRSTEPFLQQSRRPRPVLERQPRLVRELESRGVLSVCTCASRCLALTGDGRVVQWGEGCTPETLRGFDRPVTSIAVSCPCLDMIAGEEHMAAITDTGGLFTWGSNKLGQLGLPNFGPEVAQRWVSEPTRVTGGDALSEHGVRAAACGWNFTMVMTDASKLFVCGRALASTSFSCTLKPVSGMPHEEPRHIACGGHHAALVTEHGNLYTWGCGHGGQTEGNFLGHGGGSAWRNEREPKLVEALAGRVRVVQCGEIMTGVLTTDGEVYTWGDGDQASLGHGDDHEGLELGSHAHTPKQVRDLAGERVTSLAFSFGNSAAVTDDGRLFLWGARERSAWNTCSGLQARVPTLHRFQSVRAYTVASAAVGPRHTVVALRETRGATVAPDVLPLHPAQ